ncbi:MAG: hypothetical protein GX297_01070 [Treponema sp.]|nr:hypothetical protein [Treponema sp.]
MIDKHVNFFALQKACEKPGCPLCTIINERIDRYIDGMLFEHISDRTFRAQYKAAGGFCNRHSEILLSYRDGLAVAILGRDTLQDYIADFKKHRIRKRKEICPACKEQSRMEKEFLTFIAEAKEANISTNPQNNEDIPLPIFFVKSQGLCIQHYAKLITFTKKVPKWLKNFQEKRFIDLEERTSRFIDFSAWGRQKDFESLSEADKVVWKELATTLRGEVK